jgi:hypothetical protein
MMVKQKWARNNKLESHEVQTSCAPRAKSFGDLLEACMQDYMQQIKRQKKKRWARGACRRQRATACKPVTPRIPMPTMTMMLIVTG